jgi:pimeloyl-ACP methyl ester carboxylesterase
MYAIERNGTGPAVVFIHGFCQSSAYWAPTVERLAKFGVGAFAPDLPGFGASARESGPFTMAGLADAVAAQLDRWRLPRIVLVGGSMGGVVAQHFVLRHPQHVERLLLVATAGVTANEALALEKADALAAAEWNPQTVAPIVDVFFHRRPSEADVTRFREIALSASHSAAVDAARSNAINRTLEELHSVRVPTLIVQGRHDRARTPKQGMDMCERIARSRLKVLEESGHTPHLEQPEEFHEIVMPFLLGEAQTLSQRPS